MNTETLLRKIDRAQSWAGWCRVIAWVLFFAVAIFGGWMADNWFAYEQTTQKTVKEPYDYVLDTVETKVCYTTTYGECYHAGYCGYLHSSKHETTVYEALQDGYRSCSKCTPTQTITIKLTETRYRNVTETVSETVSPQGAVYGIGIASCILLGFIAPIPIDQRIKKLEQQLKKS